MTYTQFVQPIETAQRVETGFTGIFVAVEASQPFYLEIVKDALRGLQARANGAALLRAIAEAAPADNRGYNVLVHRVSISYEVAMNGTVTPRGGRSFAGGAQSRLGVTSSAAQTRGQGVSVIAGWCANQVQYTPKVGPNVGVPHFVPPPVTLGHELIHALHILRGKSLTGTTIPLDGKQVSAEEAYTVGFGPYRDKKYTENKLRADYNLPERLSYP